ncbi:MAG: single-stranded-DNA-specific exonuclease RecJ [Anaerolineales bacterium]
MNKRWRLTPPIPPDVQHSLAEYRPFEQEILFNRGIRTTKEVDAYFTFGISQDHDPFLMSGMDQAVERLQAAVASGENIVIYGDYDADGVTATALLVDVLRRIGASVGHYIPNRFNEGYGLNHDALTKIRERGGELVITVDCGVRAVDEIEHAVSLGLDVIVTDHHQPGTCLPPALAVINPSQRGDSYPFKELAGVGVAYKLAQALLRRLGQPEPIESLDLVAIGTVADIVPLYGENRQLVRMGLEQLNRTQRLGLRAIIETIGHEFGHLNTTTIGFGIGPRLNAAGRLDSAERAFNLLMAIEEMEAKHLANQLEEINRERQHITREMVERARIQVVGKDPPPLLIIAIDPGFNQGVIGLAASRLVEEFYRPSIVAAYGEKVIRGSARSIPEFHITEALDECEELLERYGGHSAAAGFSVRNERFDEFKQRINQVATEKLAEIELRPTLTVDAVVRFSDLDWSLHEFIERMEPCGYGNPFPVLAVQDVEVVSKRTVGAEGRHLKLTMRDEQKKVFDAIAFRQGHFYTDLPQRVDLAFRLERNDYRGVSSLQLNVLNIRPAGSLDDPNMTIREP